MMTLYLGMVPFIILHMQKDHSFSQAFNCFFSKHPTVFVCFTSISKPVEHPTVTAEYPTVSFLLKQIKKSWEMYTAFKGWKCNEVMLKMFFIKIFYTLLFLHFAFGQGTALKLYYFQPITSRF